MNRQDRSCPTGHGSRGRIRIERVVTFVDLRGHRAGADLRDGLERCDECRGRDYHLVAGPDAERIEGESQRVEPARDADALTNAAERGERLFEVPDGRPVRERIAVDQRHDVVDDLRPERRMRRR